MHLVRRANDACMLYLAEAGARAAAAGGRACHRAHLGRLLLLALRDAPSFVLQIDGSTGESETNASVLTRSIKCAEAMRGAGLGPGDVIVLMAPNHLDLAIPLYGALYLGVTVAPVDRTLTVNELTASFSVVRPSMVFCEAERAGDVQRALNGADVGARLVAFSPGDYLCSFHHFLHECPEHVHVDDFQAAEFEPEETVAMLIATSGTTGLPKAAAATHYNFAVTGPYWLARLSTFPTPTRLALVGSPLQWLTSIFHFLFSPLLRYSRLQSALPLDKEHAYHLINTYKPTFAVFSPTLMTALIKAEDRAACDFSCFEMILLGGSATPPDLIREFQEISPATEVRNVYGMSELTGIGFHADSADPAACGLPLGCFRYRIVNIETMEDIVEPHQQGELWMKGPGIFKGYYNNPAATAQAFAEDGWFRTGDIFYRDEHWNFYFVERHKLLLKYMSHHVSPVEVENVIRQHPGVLDVAVTGVTDPACGDLPVACVVRRPGWKLSAQEVKDIVAENLAESKQLRGGVVFVEAIPMTASTKVHRRRLREIALESTRE